MLLKKKKKMKEKKSTYRGRDFLCIYEAESKHDCALAAFAIYPKYLWPIFPKDSTKHTIDELLNNSLHLFYFLLFFP